MFIAFVTESDLYRIGHVDWVSQEFGAIIQEHTEGSL
jgi:hypothetical protein